MPVYISVIVYVTLWTTIMVKTAVSWDVMLS
jgi:hypothetical protein